MEEILRDIKAELRAHMNGVASRSMREGGLRYHVNFGVELPRLRQIAADVQADPRVCPGAPLHRLAQALWQENVRESKILAAMLMPVEGFSPQLADLWAGQIPNAEIAQTTTLYLFSRLPYAASLVSPWLASASATFQLCALLLAQRLLMQGGEGQKAKGKRQKAKDEEETPLALCPLPLAPDSLPLAQSLTASPDLHVRKAAHNLLLRMA